MYYSIDYNVSNIGMFAKLTQMIDLESRKQKIANTSAMTLNYTWETETRSYSKEFHVPQSDLCLQLSHNKEEIYIVPLKTNQSHHYAIDKYLILSNSRPALTQFLKPLWESVGIREPEIERLSETSS